MAKGKYYTPEFKEQAVKIAVGLDCTYDLVRLEAEAAADDLLLDLGGAAEDR